MKLFRLRLLPVTILVAFLALGLKVGEMLNLTRSMIVTSASAQEKATTPPAPAAPAATEAGAAKPEEAKKEEGAKTEGAEEGAELTELEENKKKREYSQVEVDLLQSLAQRRQELDNWSKQVQLKENMLIATEQRINEKIDNLQKMKKDIEDLLALYNEQEDTKIRSLVKIYENMKPKDAARIFEELDMPILLIVVDRMSERKVSPILAGMTPTKAKDLTVQLAEQRKLQKPRANAAAAATESTTPPADNSATTGNPNASPANSTASPPNAATSTTNPDGTPADTAKPAEQPAAP